MEPDAYYFIGVVVGVLLALANVVRGTLLLRQGRAQEALKFMLLGAAMMMFTTTLLLLKGA